MLDPVLQALAGLVQWQVQVVGLQLQIVLFLGQLDTLLLEVLGSLLESVSSEPGLCVSQTRVDLLQLGP